MPGAGISCGRASYLTMIGRILVKVPKIPLRVLTSYGCITEAADAHRGDGKRFVVHADEKLTAFLELESAIQALPAAN